MTNYALNHSIRPKNYPVSADETLRAHGYLAMRSTMVDLWSMPGVRPKVVTTGIRVGDTIRTGYGTGVVTRVGTIAGWFMLNGREERWENWEVDRIFPKDNS